MRKTMRIELAHEDPRHDRYFYTSLSLPAEDHEIRDAFQRIRLTDSHFSPQDIVILECHDLPEAIDVRLDSPTLDELNFLAMRLASLSEDELTVLEAIASIYIPGDEGAIISMKDLINLTYGLDVPVLSGISDDTALGTFVIENDLMEDIAPMSDFARSMLNRAAIGRLQRTNDGGVFVRGKYVVAGHYTRPTVYDGVTLPETDISTWYAFRLKLSPSPLGKNGESKASVWIDLPATPEHIAEVTRTLGIAQIRDSICTEIESSIPQIDANHFDGMSQFDHFNSLAHWLVSLDPADQVKFKAVLCAEKPSDIGGILDIARGLSRYEHDYCANRASDFFADYLLHHMDTRMDIRWIDTRYTQTSGEILLFRLGATETDYGIISARGRSLYEIVPYDTEKTETEDEDEDQGMGGMT